MNSLSHSKLSESVVNDSEEYMFVDRNGVTSYSETVDWRIVLIL